MRVFREFRVRAGSTLETDGVRFDAPWTLGMEHPDPVSARWTCRGCGVSGKSKYFPRREPWLAVQREIAASRCKICTELDHNPAFYQAGRDRLAELRGLEQTMLDALVALLSCERPVDLRVESLERAGLLVVGGGIVLTKHEPDIARRLGLLFRKEVIEVVSCVEEHAIGGYLKVPLPKVAGPGVPSYGWSVYSDGPEGAYSLLGKEDYFPGAIRSWDSLLKQFAQIVEGRASAATTSVG